VIAGRKQRCGHQHRGARAHWHYFVVVVVLLVEPVGPDMLPLEPLLVSLPELVLPGDVLDELPLVPGPPIELVLPVPLLPVLSLLLPMPAVLLLPGELLELPDGLVVVLDELEVLGGVPSRLLQAPSERAAMTVRVAAAH
jgi:hypothetical protein